ncbi:serine/threonine-protein phosphatase [bacterium]|nr:serine/threonine-protein phosphatase [bacterium]
MQNESHQAESATNHVMQCMEIWGSSSAAHQNVSTPGLDTWVWSVPFEHADGGGDVHYVSLCGGGIITRFILADVSGHGATVAEIARSLRDLMRRYINRKTQSRLTKDLNKHFGELAKLRRFATAVVATYLNNRKELTLCNAGHPRPLWYRSATRTWHFVSSDAPENGRLTNLPLGIDDSAAYPQVRLKLDDGDLILIYTDALIEASNPDGVLLGEAGLHRLIETLDPHDPAKLAKSIINSLHQYRGERPADDDFTFLLLRHRGGERKRLTVGEKLDVYAKVFGLKNV